VISGLVAPRRGRVMLGDDNLTAVPARTRGERDRTLSPVDALFPVPGERRTQLTGSLSAGEQQMRPIGRALKARARDLLSDERLTRAYLGL